MASCPLIDSRRSATTAVSVRPPWSLQPAGPEPWHVGAWCIPVAGLEVGHTARVHRSRRNHVAAIAAYVDREPAVRGVDARPIANRDTRVPVEQVVTVACLRLPRGVGEPANARATRLGRVGVDYHQSLITPVTIAKFVGRSALNHATSSSSVGRLV